MVYTDYHRCILDIWGYEVKESMLKQLMRYLEDKDCNLPKLYCKGALYLPSPHLLKELCVFLIKADICDEEVHALVKEAYLCSEGFYKQLIELNNKYRVTGQDFDAKFSVELQPIGQRLVNIISSIKIRLLILKRTRAEIISPADITNRQLSFGSAARENLYLLLYRFSLLKILNHVKLRNYYLLSTAIVSLMVVTMNYSLCYRQISEFVMGLWSVTLVLGVIVTAVAAYPLHDFKSTDIFGRNMTAHRYRMFINNFRNKKIMKAVCRIS